MKEMRLLSVLLLVVGALAETNCESLPESCTQCKEPGLCLYSVLDTFQYKLERLWCGLVTTLPINQIISDVAAENDFTITADQVSGFLNSGMAECASHEDVTLDLDTSGYDEDVCRGELTNTFEGIQINILVWTIDIDSAAVDIIWDVMDEDLKPTLCAILGKVNEMFDFESPGECSAGMQECSSQYPTECTEGMKALIEDNISMTKVIEMFLRQFLLGGKLEMDIGFMGNLDADDKWSHGHGECDFLSAFEDSDGDRCCQYLTCWDFELLMASLDCAGDSVLFASWASGALCQYEDGKYCTADGDIDAARVSAMTADEIEDAKQLGLMGNGDVEKISIGRLTQIKKVGERGKTSPAGMLALGLAALAWMIH